MGCGAVRAEVVLANVNAGLLYVMAITSMGVDGIVIAGRRTRSTRSSGAQRCPGGLVRTAMGFALVCVLMVAQSLNLSDIVRGSRWG